MVRLACPRVAAVMVVVFVLSGARSSAEELQAPTLRKSGEDAAVSGNALPSTPVLPIGTPAEQQRPNTLIPLYVSFGVLQVFDTQSTVDAIARGGMEANPVLKGIAGNPVALVAVKAAGTSGVIFATEKMWKKNKRAAVIFMMAANCAMAWVVKSNHGAAR